MAIPIRLPSVEGVTSFMDGLGITEARIGILHTLLEQGGSAFGPELVELTGISRAMVGYHMLHLERHGLVIGSRERSTTAVKWTVNYELLRREWDAVEQLILPPKG